MHLSIACSIYWPEPSPPYCVGYCTLRQSCRASWVFPAPLSPHSSVTPPTGRPPLSSRSSRGQPRLSRRPQSGLPWRRITETQDRRVNVHHSDKPIRLFVVSPGVGGCRLQAKAEALSSCWTSERDRPVSLCRSVQETHRTSLVDFKLARRKYNDAMLTVSLANTNKTSLNYG